MLKKRIITTLVAIPILVIAVWFDKPLPWFTLLAAIWGALAILEFYKVAHIPRMTLLSCFGLVWTLMFIISPHFDYGSLTPLLLTTGILLSMTLLIFRSEKDGAFSSWVWTIAGILYIGWLLSYLVALRLEAGREWLLLALFATFGSDTNAFFVGRLLGRHRMAPRISPAKTWEGAIGGLIGAVIASLVISSVLGIPLKYGQAIALGLLVSVFAQLGDLVESLLKRNTGIKESGNLVAGHGGILDRMDSVVFAGAAVYYYALAYSAGWLNWL
jgi:phosphatidate cytidylyltransferase